MSPVDELTTAEVARLLGVDRSAVVRMVERGELTPSRKLPGRTGAYLFPAGDVRALAEERAA